MLDRLFSCDDLQDIVFKKIDLTKNEYLIKKYLYIHIERLSNAFIFNNTYPSFFNNFKLKKCPSSEVNPIVFALDV